LIDIVPKARIIVNNRFPNDNYEEPYENVSKLLQNSGIDEFLSPHWLPFVNLEPLEFTSDKIFSQSLRSVLDELDM
jgi:chromosome partitioning protein